jgi:predicted O-linked N-acetylglucosamine transferase (SPINDLY family)
MPSPAIVRAMQQAVAHHQAGRLADAEKIYRQVLQQSPRDADALQLLGLLHHQTGRNDLAVELISKAITIRPRAEFFINLSQAYRELGRHAERLTACQRAVQMAPNIPEAWNNLGSAYKEMNRLVEAKDAIERALKLRPNFTMAWNNLGNTLAMFGQAPEAEAAFRKAMATDPRYAEAYSNLAEMLSRLGRRDEAVALSLKALELKPQLVAAYVNLGAALHMQGRLDEGDEAFRRGIHLQPNHEGLHQNLLNSMIQTTRTTPEQAFAAYVGWANRFATPRAAPPAHRNRRDLGRKLRVGYVSPDLRRHSVSFFLEPILEQHDRAQFGIALYSNTIMPDDVTDRLRGKCDLWRDITALTDDQAAEMIRRDEIDILVDLAGHTVRNRLTLFGRKPAPVQVTYLGFPNTTGVRAIDYRLTDALADPVGQTERFHVEKLIRLPPPFLCYRPPDAAPPVADPPAARIGYVTFGSFNRASKAGPETIELWSRVLSAVAGSKLIMKSRGLGDVGSRDRLLRGFTAHGIAPQRIELIEANQGLTDHLALYGRIDIALDTFPYHGTTTTCEAMWMGVPTVSLVGQVHHSRVGLSLLTSVGLPWLAVEGVDPYVALAGKLAGDLPALVRLRQDMRQRVAASPLCDAARLTRAIEVEYRQMINAWIQGPVG